ncbi:MAG: hypothetical protein Q7S57_06040 [bacterium]|nr:hypothetical protein [bacterium]
MKNILKIILIGAGGVIVIIGGLYFLVLKGVISVNIFPNARTLYTGYVKIEPILLSEIKIKLEAQGCRVLGKKYENNNTRLCRYGETIVEYDKKNGLEIWPQGMGFGPGFIIYMTSDKIWAEKDIFGSPDSSKFKDSVRRDVSKIGNIVSIKENTWKITKTKYPWTVIY